MWLYRAPCRAPILSVDQSVEQKRVQELLRFFQPDAAAIKDKKARVAKDTSLTAFAQLGALRLDCQRAFISLIDNQHQYVLAEATRSISLASEDVHDGGDDDAVFLGATTLDLVWGVCPSTIQVFTSQDDSLDVDSTYVKANRSYYIMNDLSKVEGFEDRPYIAGWPYMRYYAEVPIHSPSGLTIGSFCVIDNKPRDGIDVKGLQVLREIADSIMDHLELVMCKQQRERAERMIQSLGLFVEGKASLRDWWMKSTKYSRTIDSSQRALTVEERADIEFFHDSKAASRPSLVQAVKSTQSDKSNGPCGSPPRTLTASPIFDSSLQPSPAMVLKGASVSKDFNSEVNTNAPHRLSAESPNDPISTLNNNFEIGASDTSVKRRKTSTQTPASSTDRYEHSKASTDLEEMLSRAANLIREAIGLDGVTFYDANLSRSTHKFHAGTRTHAVGIPKCDATQGVESGQNSTTNDSTNSASIHGKNPPLPQSHFCTSYSSKNQYNMCKVLAYSTRTNSTIRGDAPLEAQLTLPEPSLRRILQKYPNGGIVQFDAEGRLTYNEFGIHQTPYGMKTDAQPLAIRRSQSDSEEPCMDYLEDFEAEDLLRIMPGARSVILLPLWDSSRDRFFAFNIGWTTSPTRILELEEMIYLTSFANSVLAELSRLDTLAADKAKADFISSISHELRSPLHGVLASAELLREINVNSTQSHLIHTIEVCGSTLLDTMDNLLTFAKINSFAVVQRKESNGASTAQDTNSDAYRSLTTDLDLRILVEEVVEASIAGHSFRHPTEQSFLETSLSSANRITANESQHKVMVICDVEWRSDWHFSTQAGAWKRILMNLLGNALKYTEYGFIHISLKFGKESATDFGGIRQTGVTLTVKDSGKGISEEYLKHHLYKPFAQENSLSVGTGLGLSIVRQLVSSINGSIEVTSDTSSGTQVEVTALLSVPNPKPPSVDENCLALKNLRMRLRGLELGIVGFDRCLDSEARKRGADRWLVLESCIRKTATEWFGMNIHTLSTYDRDTADIFISTDIQFEHDEKVEGNLGTRQRLPWVVLCEQIKPAYRDALTKREGLVFVTQPFGPQKLAKALALCLEHISPNSQIATSLCTSSPGIDRSGSGAVLKNLKSLDLGEGAVRSLSLASPQSQSGGSSSHLQSGLLPQKPVNTNGNTDVKRRARILAVEDNPINLRLLVTYLERIGCDSITATNGLEALEAYKQSLGNIDLVFMDISMPIMDGMTSARSIRDFEQQHSLSPTIIIALTGLASLQSQKDAFSSGIDEFWTKPIKMSKLRAVVDARFPCVDQA